MKCLKLTLLGLALMIFVSPLSVVFAANSPQQQYPWVLVTSKALAPSFMPLAEHRMAQGKGVKVYLVEEISAQYPGHDIQEKIRACLITHWRRYGLRWLVLGGDETIIPVRNMRTSDQWTDEVPAELYYADFDGGTWDTNGDGIFNSPFGEVGVRELSPECAVGRIPITTPEQVRAYINKVKRYEDAQNGNRPNRLLIVAGGGKGHPEYNLCGSARPANYRHYDPVGNADSGYMCWYWDMVQPHWPAIAFELISQHTSWDERYWGDYLTNKITMTEKLNTGNFEVIMYTGHAYPAAFLLDGLDPQSDEYSYFTVEDALHLTNPIPFVFRAGGCNAAHFDADATSVCEALLLNPYGGAVLVTAHTRGVAYSRQDEFFSDLVSSATHNYGDAFTKSAVDDAPNHLQDVYSHLIYVMFGDPAINMLPMPVGRYLQLTCPSALEQYGLGDDIIIRWTANGSGFQPEERVCLEYSTDDGVTWRTIPGADAVPYNARSFTWTKPKLAEGTAYRLRVSSLVNPTVSSVSRKPFAVRRLVRVTITCNGTVKTATLIGKHAGVAPYDITIPYGEVLDIRAPRIAGQDFIGWFTADGQMIRHSTTFPATVKGDFAIEMRYAASPTMRTIFLNDATADGDTSPAGNDANDGLSSQAPMRHINEAIARYGSPSLRLVFARGRYDENVISTIPQDKFELIGAGSDVTVLDGGAHSNVLCVMNVKRFKATGITISNGKTDTKGGGVWLDAAYAELIQCRIVENVGQFGGGLFMTGGRLQIVDCNISGNHASVGGGVDVASLEEMIVTRSRFMTNVSELRGGAINMENCKCARFDEVVCDGNTVVKEGGGGLLMTGGRLQIVDCTISRNHASVGGGVDVDSLEEMTVTRSRFMTNVSELRGGAINMVNLKCARFDEVVFDGNTAVKEGGGGVKCIPSDAMIFNRCQWLRNQAPTGGAIEFYYTGTVTMLQGVFYNNRAKVAPAIYVGYKEKHGFTMNGCDVKGNVADDGGPAIVVAGG